MARHSFIQMTKLPNVKGRISYITSKSRQENLYATYRTADNAFWSNLASGKLNSYLADINEQAESMLYRLVKEMTAKENVTEQLKAEQPMLWVQLMNNIHNRAEEVINSEIIYA